MTVSVHIFLKKYCYNQINGLAEKGMTLEEYKTILIEVEKNTKSVKGK